MILVTWYSRIPIKNIFAKSLPQDLIYNTKTKENEVMCQLMAP